MVHRPKPGFHVLLYGGRQGQTTGDLTITVFQQKKGKQNSRRWKSGRWLLLFLKILFDPKQLELRSTGHRFAHLSVSPL